MSVDLFLRCLWTFGDVSVIFRNVEMSVDPSRCQLDLWRSHWICGDVSGSVEISVDLWRCQWTFGDVSVIIRHVEMSVDPSRCQWICGDFSGPVKMSVDLSKCQWTCRDVNVRNLWTCQVDSVIFGSVEMLVELSRFQCVLWTCQNISGPF